MVEVFGAEPTAFPLEKRDALPDPITPQHFKNRGGGERIRTDGLLRARQALSQLSYTPQRLMRIWIADFGIVVVFKSKIRNLKSEIAWWAWMELNHRPHAYQACALTKLSYRPLRFWISEYGSRIYHF